MFGRNQTRSNYTSSLFNPPITVYAIFIVEGISLNSKIIELYTILLE